MKNIKKVLIILAIAAIIFSAFSIAAYGDEIINLSGQIEVNREIIEAPDAYVHSSEDVIMLPLRAVAESLGYVVLWEEGKIIVGYGIQLFIGESYYRVGDSGQTYISAPPELINGRTFVPVDFIRYVLGYEVLVSDGRVIVEQSLTSILWVAPDATTVWFSDDSPHENGGELTKLGVGKTTEGRDVFSLIRMPLRGDWLADEITEARLFLKIAEGTPQTELYIGTVAYSWNHTFERDVARSILHEDSFVLTEMRQEEGGWVSMDVTDIVAAWLRSEIPNRGFALFPGDDETFATFVSGMSAPIGHAPRIVISAEMSERSTSYGRFGFTKQPGQGIIEPMLGGNCFSYALRDLDGIYHADLNFDFDELNRIFFESGPNGVLEHVADILTNYVETHSEALQISSFRRIDSFDSPIDPNVEYRIVLRVAAHATPEVPMNERWGFDFHFWMQLNDGRWTQTNPVMFSEIIYGTGPGIDPAKFIWDAAGVAWGIERYQEWYNSDVVYFAVTKDTDEFTRHMQAAPVEPPGFIFGTNPGNYIGTNPEITGEIIVNSSIASVPTPFVYEGVIMLPLRAIAEALDFAVIWDESQWRVDVGENYVIWIDRPMISRDGGQTP